MLPMTVNILHCFFFICLYVYKKKFVNLHRRFQTAKVGKTHEQRPLARLVNATNIEIQRIIILFKEQ